MLFGLTGTHAGIVASYIFASGMDYGLLRNLLLDIRHPVYIGEPVAMVGILLNVPNYLNLVAMILWAIGQITRACLPKF